MDLGISGKVALVCGSSAGMGRAIAARLATEGCRVAINGRNAARLKEAETVLSQHRNTVVIAFRADVSVSGEAMNLVRQVENHFGSLDILVCNAAGPRAAPFEEVPAESWQSALELNLLSTVNLCRAAVAGMRARRWGRIVCLTSIAAKQPVAGLILSTTARAGVHGFAKCLADELAPHGVTVNAVCPGYVRTDRVTELVDQRARETQQDPAGILAGMVANIPMRRIGEPDEVGAAVAFLASEHAAYITGVALQVDGGLIRSIM